MSTFWLALGLLLIVEGLLPFIHPAAWREMFQRLIQLPDAQLRTAGFISIAAGLALLWAL